VARALADVGDVDVVVVDAEGGREEWERSTDHEFNVVAHVTVEPRRNHTIAKKMQWVLSPRMLYPNGQGVDSDAAAQIVEVAERYDLIWFCKLPTANAFPCWNWSRSVADIDDVPSTFERSAWERAQGLKEGVLAGVRLVSWTRRDKLLGERFTVLGVCSEVDKQYLQGLGVDAPIHVIPNGYERPAIVPVRRVATPPRLGFIGIFDYFPNRDGIQWFANHCWPLIKREVPDARLRLVGRYSDGTLAPKGPDIDGLGWIAEADDEISTWSAMVVPIHLGGGTRGKIAHAFSVKCPVISTPHGAYGYGATDGREMALAQSAPDFAAACVRAIRQPDDARDMAERAWQLFLTRWNWDAIRPSVWASVEDCLRRSRTVERLPSTATAIANNTVGQ
jgi:glycosyltransferase involved in cell wall biosynthesis